MNIFKKTYDENKKAFDEMGLENYLEFITCQEVVKTAFLESIGMTQRYKDFMKKFVETVETEMRNNRK